MRQKYDFPGIYLADAYVEICQRKQTLSVEEGHQIGVEALVLITQSRELLVLKWRYWSTEEKKEAIISKIKPLLQML